MFIVFIIICLLLIVTVPLHFKSIEHKKLVEKYGQRKGEKIGILLGKLSGYGNFFFCIAILVLPQQHFQLLDQSSFIFTIGNVSIPVVRIIIALPFIIGFVIIENRAVKAVSMKTATTHVVDKIITNGIYNCVRHPQHLGQLLLYIGMNIIFAGLYSLLFFPIYVLILVILSMKEEKELIAEFGDAYVKYKSTIPMLILLHKRK